MDTVSAVVVYILLWWWVLFMVLPFGAKAPDTIEAGHASSAPARPRIIAVSYTHLTLPTTPYV